MANYSRWTEAKHKRPVPTAETRAGVEQDLALGQLIYDLRTGAGLSQRELAERWRITTRTLDRWRVAGTGPVWLRINDRVLYRAEDVFAFEALRLRRPRP